MLYSLQKELQEDARSVNLSWVGNGVLFDVSTDNGKTWESVENGMITRLKNPGRKIVVKALLPIDSNTFLDNYILEINPAGYSLFTGKVLEESIGLVYFGARWYDPEVGRFISVDPIEDGGNWYSFCYNNPINRIDPDGTVAPWWFVLLSNMGFGACLTPPEASDQQFLINMGASALGGQIGYIIKAPMMVKGAAASAVTSATSQILGNGNINWSLVTFDTMTGAGLGLIGDFISPFAQKRNFGGNVTEDYIEQRMLRGTNYLKEPVFRSGNIVGFDRPMSNTTRPDFYALDILTSYEGKNVGNLSTLAGQNDFIKKTVHQAIKRSFHIPRGSKQMLIIDIRGQHVSQKMMKRMIDEIYRQSKYNIQKILFVTDQFNYFAPYTSNSGKN